MSRQLRRIAGLGTGGDYLGTTPPTEFAKKGNFYQPVKEDVDLWLAGVIQRNIYAGGSTAFELDGSATGNFDLQPWVPILADNTNNQITAFTDANSAVLVVQMRFIVWVSNAAINVTPRIIRGATMATISTVVTISGQVACSDTTAALTGATQNQVVAITLPNAAHYFKPQITIAGTPAAGYTVKGLAVYDCYVSLP